MVSEGKKRLKQDYKTSLRGSHEAEGAQVDDAIQVFRNMKLSTVF
jgi:hypothetical protein